LKELHSYSMVSSSAWWVWNTKIPWSN
jgi:hypothetical protein